MRKNEMVGDWLVLLGKSSNILRALKRSLPCSQLRGWMTPVSHRSNLDMEIYFMCAIELSVNHMKLWAIWSVFSGRAGVLYGMTILLEGAGPLKFQMTYCIIFFSVEKMCNCLLHYEKLLIWYYLLFIIKLKEKIVGTWIMNLKTLLYDMSQYYKHDLRHLFLLIIS